MDSNSEREAADGQDPTDRLAEAVEEEDPVNNDVPPSADSAADSAVDDGAVSDEVSDKDKLELSHKGGVGSPPQESLAGAESPAGAESEACADSARDSQASAHAPPARRSSRRSRKTPLQGNEREFNTILQVSNAVRNLLPPLFSDVVSDLDHHLLNFLLEIEQVEIEQVPQGVGTLPHHLTEQIADKFLTYCYYSESTTLHQQHKQPTANIQ